MTLKRRQFSKDFKLHVLGEIAAGKSVAQAAGEHQLYPNLIAKWQKQHQQYGALAVANNGHTYTDEVHIAELEGLIGQLTIENATLKKVLQQLERQRRQEQEHGL